MVIDHLCLVHCHRLCAVACCVTWMELTSGLWGASLQTLSWLQRGGWEEHSWQLQTLQGTLHGSFLQCCLSGAKVWQLLCLAPEATGGGKNSSGTSEVDDGVIDLVLQLKKGKKCRSDEQLDCRWGRHAVLSFASNHQVGPAIPKVRAVTR